MNGEYCLIGIAPPGAELSADSVPAGVALGPMVQIPLETPEDGLSLLRGKSLSPLATWILTKIDPAQALHQAIALRDRVANLDPVLLVDGAAVDAAKIADALPFLRDDQGLFFALDHSIRRRRESLTKAAAAQIQKSASSTASLPVVVHRHRVIRIEVLIGLVLILVYNFVEAQIGDSFLGKTFREGSYRLLSGQLFAANRASVNVVNLAGTFDERTETGATFTRLESVAQLLQGWASNPDTAPRAVAVDIACGQLDRVSGATVDTDEEIRAVEASQTLDAAAASLEAAGIPVFLAAESIFPTQVKAGNFYPQSARLAHAVVGVRGAESSITLADQMKFGSDLVVQSLAERVAVAIGAKKQSPPWLQLYLEPDREATLSPGQIAFGPRYFVNYAVLDELRLARKSANSVEEALSLPVRGQIVVLGNDDAVQDPKRHPITGEIFSGVFLQAAAIRTKLDSPVYLFTAGTANAVSSALAVFTMFLAAVFRSQRAVSPHPEGDKLTHWIFALQLGVSLGLAVAFARGFGILWLEYMGMSFVAVLQLVIENVAGLSERIEKLVKV